MEAAGCLWNVWGQTLAEKGMDSGFPGSSHPACPGENRTLSPGEIGHLVSFADCWRQWSCSSCSLQPLRLQDAVILVKQRGALLLGAMGSSEPNWGRNPAGRGDKPTPWAPPVAHAYPMPSTCPAKPAPSPNTILASCKHWACFPEKPALGSWPISNQGENLPALLLPSFNDILLLALGFVLRWATRNTSRVGTFPKLLAVCLNRCGALFCAHLSSSWCCRSCCSCGRQRNPSFVSLQQIHLQTLFWLLYCVFTFNLPVLFFNSSLGQAFSMQRPSPFLHSLLCPAI